MKTRAENRCHSIDLLLNERLAQLFRLAQAKTPEQLPNEDPTAEPDVSISTPVRELGRNPRKRATPNPEGLIRGALVSTVPKGQRVTPVNGIISRCLKDRRKILDNYIN